MPTDTLSCRFTVDQLTSFYNDFRRNAAFDNVLDAQTFMTLLITGIQSNRVPKAWSYMPFEKFGLFAKKFKKAPLSDDNALGDEEQEALFSALSQDDARQFVDWKLIMVTFVLLNSPKPTMAQLTEYM